jgi:hypothetical protein
MGRAARPLRALAPALRAARRVLAGHADPFRPLAFDGGGGAAAELAEELAMSVAADYTAEARVLHLIRQDAEGLID